MLLQTLTSNCLYCANNIGVLQRIGRFPVGINALIIIHIVAVTVAVIIIVVTITIAVVIVVVSADSIFIESVCISRIRRCSRRGRYDFLLLR